MFLFKHFGRNMFDHKVTPQYQYAVATLIGLIGLVFMRRFAVAKKCLEFNKRLKKTIEIKSQVCIVADVG